MKCEICGASVANGATLYRVNPKGQRGIWRCIVHMDKMPDPELRRIVEIIERHHAAKPEPRGAASEDR